MVVKWTVLLSVDLSLLIECRCKNLTESMSFINSSDGLKVEFKTFRAYIITTKWVATTTMNFSALHIWQRKHIQRKATRTKTMLYVKLLYFVTDSQEMRRQNLQKGGPS